MIDPRALQQHFRKVYEKQQPLNTKPDIPRVLITEPLTAIKAITIPIDPIIDTSNLQKELLEVTHAQTTLKQSLSQTSQIEPITLTAPVTVATTTMKINEQGEEKINDDYDPYSYYSSPKF